MIIRYSMIHDFQVCPKHYYERYVLNKVETKESSALHFGTALHLGIKTILEGEDGIEPFNMYWESIKETQMIYYGDSWNILKELAVGTFLPNFKSRHSKNFTDFQQELKMEMPFLGEHVLQGTADLIGLYKGKLCVADWKTSSKPYRKNRIAVNYQMPIYAKLYEHNFGKLPEVIIYKVFNKKDSAINTFEFEVTPKIMEEYSTQIQNISKRLIETSADGAIYHGADCYCSEV